ncbi:MAG TPA: bifunctional shikimate kinase/3-dehydroquinate synthase [Acidimicrobiia bacterium]|nr:bifunctional shikimate kinase/3-dehydroquinate synthase [Acidimicrobiia bacterium]
MTTIWLTGMMGAGKSTVAPLVAARLNRESHDTDALVELRTGSTVEDLFAAGEARFRVEEAAAVQAVAGSWAVVACGGGVVLDADLVADMRRTGVVVWLRAPVEVLEARTFADRPLLAGDSGALRRIAAEREGRYRAAADLVVDAVGAPEEVAARVVAAVSTVGGVTQVVVGREVLGPEEVLGGAAPATCALLTQPGASSVAARVARGIEASGIRTEVIEVPDREGAKSWSTVERVCMELATARVGRGDLLMGVGGGAVTDLTGFVAAIYLRGVRVHFVATTLLAAVDAAIGGKSGIDVGGKNLVGAFRHPERVVIDLDVLGELPVRLIREGLAEALKAGLVGDPGLVELLERHSTAADLEEVVARSHAVKARIVGRDFTDRSERAHLNYGHTVGHAVESVSGIPHGDAVAIGMIAAGRASALDAGFDGEQRQRDVIAGLGLPVATATSVDPAAILEHMALDKKRGRKGTRMVLLEAVGRPTVTAVGPATVDAALAAAGVLGGES